MDAATLPATLGTKSPTICNELERRWAVTIRLKSFYFSEGQHWSVSSFHCSACVVWRPLCSSNASTRPEWQSEDGLRVFLDVSGHVRFPLACLALIKEMQMKAHILQENSYVVLGSRKDGNIFPFISRGSDGAKFEAPPVVEFYIGDDDVQACSAYFRLVQASHQTPCRTVWRVQRSLGHQHLGQRAQPSARSLKGDGSTVLKRLCFQK